MKKILAVMAACAAVMACQKEAVQNELPSEKPVEEKMPINLSMDFQTRVSDTAFDEGDEAGIYVVSFEKGQPGSLAESGNQYDNVKLSLNTTWQQAEQMYWADKETPVDFYCYHPYNVSGGVAKHHFEIKADQSSLTNFKASDFVWGKASNIRPTKEVIPIQTNHMMSNIVIKLTRGNGFSAEKWASAVKNVKINGIKTSADISLVDGMVTVGGSATDIIPYKVAEDSYKAIIVPQTVSATGALITITVDNTAYTFKKSFTFLSGKQHNFTIRVSKSGSGIDVGVGDWENDNTDNGGDAE